MQPVHLRLYVTGHTVSAERARAALAEVLRRACTQWGNGVVVADVVDVLESPEIAARDGIFATPTLVRMGPGPEPSIRLFGDLSSPTTVMAGLRLGPPRAAGRSVASAYPTGKDVPSCPAFMIPSVTSSSPAAAPE